VDVVRKKGVWLEKGFIFFFKSVRLNVTVNLRILGFRSFFLSSLDRNFSNCQRVL